MGADQIISSFGLLGPCSVLSLKCFNINALFILLIQVHLSGQLIKFGSSKTKKITADIYNSEYSNMQHQFYTIVYSNVLKAHTFFLLNNVGPKNILAIMELF